MTIQKYRIVELMTSSYVSPSFLKDEVSLEEFLEFRKGPSHGPHATYVIDNIEEWPNEVILKRLQLRYRAMVHIYVAVKIQDIATFISRWEQNYLEKRV